MELQYYFTGEDSLNVDYIFLGLSYAGDLKFLNK